MENLENRVLLTALGLNPKETTYTLENRTCKSLLSPVALYNLLPEDDRFDRVLALCTDEVLEKTFPMLRCELPVRCEPVRVLGGVSADDLQATVHNMLEKIPEKAELTLDVTHGFRHYPFLFFTACLYLKALKDVEIQRIWYGRLDGKNPDGAAPFIDLSILLEMVDWFRVVQSFRDMSKPKALAQKLSDYGKGMKRPDERIPNMKRYRAIASAAKDFAELFGMGLPLELGMASADLQRRIDGFRRECDLSAIKIPLADDLLLEIEKVAERFRLSEDREKRDLVLDLEEIHRQEKLINAYFEAGYHNNAIGLIRELVISRLMLRYEDGKKNWLDISQRKRFERCMGALVDYSKKNSATLTDDRKKLAGIWSSIIDARNRLHHHGMTVDKVSGKQIEIPAWWEDLKQRLDDSSFWDCDFGGGSGRLLISALGLHPGFLYSALRNENPEACLVVASHETVSRWDELARRAGYSGDLKIEETDAHSFEGIKRIVDESEGLLVRFDEVVCNLTGGTAAMQYAVIQLARRAERLGRKVRWIAVIDNRSPDEQNLNPYAEGEVVCLEDAGI